MFDMIYAQVTAFRFTLNHTEIVRFSFFFRLLFTDVLQCVSSSSCLFFYLVSYPSTALELFLSFLLEVFCSFLLLSVFLRLAAPQRVSLRQSIETAIRFSMNT